MKQQQFSTLGLLTVITLLLHPAHAATWRSSSNLFHQLQGGGDKVSRYHNSASIDQIKSKVRASSSVDVAIVGAGYSGLIAARELARDGYKVTVVSLRDLPPCGTFEKVGHVVGIRPRPKPSECPELAADASHLFTESGRVGKHAGIQNPSPHPQTLPLSEDCADSGGQIPWAVNRGCMYPCAPHEAQTEISPMCHMCPLFSDRGP